MELDTIPLNGTFDNCVPSPANVSTAINLPNEPVETPEPDIPPSTKTRSELESSVCHDPEITSASCNELLTVSGVIIPVSSDPSPVKTAALA